MEQNEREYEQNQKLALWKKLIKYTNLTKIKSKMQKNNKQNEKG